METIELINVVADRESTAVAAAKLILDGALPLMIEDNDLSEAAWSEMVAYLRRRGVAVEYDHGLGFPVAREAV